VLVVMEMAIMTKVTPMRKSRSRTNGRANGKSLELQLKGYRLSTVEIVYHMPDHPSLLQTFIWQYMDLAPDYPELHKFLDFWRKNLDGALHSVRVMSKDIVGPAEFGKVSHSLALH
jgi:uncharacterized protein Usg